MILDFKSKKPRRYKTKFGLLTAHELSKVTGLNDVKLMRTYISKHGIEDAIIVIENRSNKKTATYNGNQISISEIQDITGFTWSYINKKQELGIDIKDCLVQWMERISSNPSCKDLDLEQKRKDRINARRKNKDFAQCRARNN